MILDCFLGSHVWHIHDDILHQHFKMTGLGILDYFLGLHVWHIHDGIFVS
jgi:hypothetical protein